jgi:hypothetical protein
VPTTTHDDLLPLFDCIEMFAVFSSLIRVTRSVASSSYPYLKEHDSGFGGVHPSSNSKLSFVILCRKASSLRIDCRNGLITCTYSREDSQWMLDTMQKDNSSLTCHWWNAESLHRTRLTELRSPPPQFSQNVSDFSQILVKTRSNPPLPSYIQFFAQAPRA